MNKATDWWLRHMDRLYKVTILALIGLWVIYPPQQSHTSLSERAATTVQLAKPSP